MEGHIGDYLEKGVDMDLAKGKYGLFKRDEDYAVEKLIGEKKTAVEVSLELKRDGIECSPEKLRRLKADAFNSLVDEQKREAMADYLLDSIQKVTIKFESIFNKFETIYDKFEEEGRYTEQLIVLRDLKEMLNMSLKKLGEYKHGVERIKIDNMQIISNNDIVMALKDNQDRWFEMMDPEYKDGKLIFNKPLPEVLDGFDKWRFRQGRSEILQ